MNVRRCMNCMKEFSVPPGYEDIALCCPHCGYLEGSLPKELNHLYPGTILKDRYQIGVAVGYGGFGITYKAWDMQLDIVVAIKEYYPTGVVTREPGKTKVIVYEGDNKDGYYEGLERFLEEARRTARYDHSKYIVQVFNYFQENNTAYLVMEYLPGISLKEYLKMVGKLPVEDALEITDAIMEALKELHHDGILHRDIGPGNIFIFGRDVKVIDFGAARLSEADKELTRSVVLTPGYELLTISGYLKNNKGENIYRITEGKRYFNKDGDMESGLVSITGSQALDDGTYYFKDDINDIKSFGIMQTGWVKLSGQWYYFNESGVMQTGWKQIDKTWYYFNTDGSMAAKEWRGGYWLNKDGSCTYQYKAVWKKDKNGWWYGDSSGWYAKKSWQKINGKWYYFNADGYMVTGTQEIGGKTYKFNAEGVCLTQ